MNKFFIYRLCIYSLLAIFSAATKSLKREIKLGTSFKLKCDSGSYSEVKWYKNDNLMYPSKRSSRISIKSKGTKSLIKVRNAKSNDKGLYECYGFKNGMQVNQIVAYKISLVSGKY